MVSTRKYLTAKKKASWAIYQAKYKAEWNGFGDFMGRDDQKCDMFKTVKRMIKTSLKNDDSVLAVSDEDNR